MICQACGKAWSQLDTRSNYFFSSLSHKKGDYTSPAIIFGLGEDILTCPACSSHDDNTGQGHSPSGARLKHEGDDNRQTAGDEHYDKLHPFD